MSISNYLENAILDKVFSNTNFTVTTPYIKLHTGDPGEDGTANAATETTRKAVTFGTPAASGSITSTTDALWTNVAASETYSYVSIWDASSAGNCLWTGPMVTPRAVLATQEFQISAAGLTATIS